MIRRVLLVCIIVAVIASAFGSMDMGDQEAYSRLANAYRAILFKSKRSPSMGLSLAEYMASPKGGADFHFIPSGRK